MEIRETRHGAVTVLKPIGPLIQGDSGAFATRVEDAVTKSLGRFAVDVSAVPFVDSAGLEALVDAGERMTEHGQTLRLCGAGETLRETLELTEVADLFDYYEDVTDATRSFL